MSDVTELRCWPSCLDAIDWSQDGIIALASDERVELLFPNTVTFDRDQDVPQWQHIPLKVPWFSNDELPIKESAPLEDYSIGEEVSASAPLAIAWSSPGLAKHRRCALAVLTSNLVLSIWSADGKPKLASDWNRRLIVNDALAEYFTNMPNRELSSTDSTLEERLRRKSRIRSFTWAPSFPNTHAFSVVGTRLLYGQHILAVCNDDNELAFIVITSPHTTHGPQQCWKAEVLTHICLTVATPHSILESSTFDDLMRQQRHLSQVSWSPWVLQCGRFRSIVVYATNKDVRSRIITYENDVLTADDEMLYPDIGVRFTGPMKWSPLVEDGTSLALALFTTAGLVHLTLSTKDASIIERTTHDLDCRWDQISGVVWDSLPHKVPRLHISSLLSTTQSPTCVLEVSSEGLVALESPSWRDQIENSAILFSVKNDLKGNSKVKVWGVASSPLGDFIATCNSVHPADMIEYGAPNDRRGTVAVSALRRYREIRGSFASQDVSAEGILFTLKKLVENTVEDTDQMSTFTQEIVGKLIQAYRPSSVSRTSLFNATKPGDIQTLLTNIKEATYADQDTLKDRYTILVSHACDTTISNELARTLIAFRLATLLQDLAPSLTQTPFSSEIVAHHGHIISLIQHVINPSHREADQSPAQGAYRCDHHLDAVSSNTKSSGKELELAADACDFCCAPIPFTSLISATCTNGHQFPRCGLSFLAIQAPDITKYCGICSTPFLSEEFVLAQEEEAGLNSAENLANESTRNKFAITSARALFIACDVCIYCGGKFVD